MSGEKKLEIERFEHVLSGVVEEIAKEDFREFKPHAKGGGNPGIKEGSKSLHPRWAFRPFHSFPSRNVVPATPVANRQSRWFFLTRILKANAKNSKYLTNLSCYFYRLIQILASEISEWTNYNPNFSPIFSNLTRVRKITDRLTGQLNVRSNKLISISYFPRKYYRSKRASKRERWKSKFGFSNTVERLATITGKRDLIPPRAT